jgi:hypothetical protein
MVLVDYQWHVSVWSHQTSQSHRVESPNTVVCALLRSDCETRVSPALLAKRAHDMSGQTAMGQSQKCQPVHIDFCSI